jgi:short-subunit dehydrogenase
VIDARRYGPWALVAGASEGIGAAFARELAASGLSVVAVARRTGPLDELAASLPTPCRTVAADLATDDGVDALFAATADLDVGLVVANAAYVPIGAYLGRDESDLRRAVDLNCTAAVRLAHHYLPAMVARRAGGLVIVSSLAGAQGTPGIATYAATKAFGAVLAEGLWAEMRGYGVDVLACTPGAVSTPGLAANKPRRTPGTVTPDVVARSALRALGHRPRTVPGALMKVSALLTGRVLGRRTAIALIARASADLLD